MDALVVGDPGERAVGSVLTEPPESLMVFDSAGRQSSRAFPAVIPASLRASVRRERRRGTALVESCVEVFGFQGQKGIRKRNGESWQPYLIILISLQFSLFQSAT